MRSGGVQCKESLRASGEDGTGAMFPTLGQLPAVGLVLGRRLTLPAGLTAGQFRLPRAESLPPAGSSMRAERTLQAPDAPLALMSPVQEQGAGADSWQDSRYRHWPP